MLTLQCELEQHVSMMWLSQGSYTLGTPDSGDKFSCADSKPSPTEGLTAHVGLKRSLKGDFAIKPATRKTLYQLIH